MLTKTKKPVRITVGTRTLPRRGLLLLCIVLAAVLPIGAQSVSTSTAGVHYAGHDLISLDGVEIGGVHYRMYIAADDEGMWRLTNIEAQKADRIPDNVVLDLATLRMPKDGTLVIHDIFLDGQFYTATVEFNAAMGVVQSYSVAAVPPPRFQEHPVLSQLVEVYEGELREYVNEDAVEADATPDSPPSQEDEASTVQGSLPEGAPIIQPEGEDLPPNESENAFDLDPQAVVSYSQGVSETLDEINQRVTRIESAVDSLTSMVARDRDESPRDREDTPRDQTITLSEARIAMTSVESIDLGNATPLEGEWEVTVDTALQSDRSARFAKLRIGYQQDSRPRLYRFLAQSLDDGWAGWGLHFSIEDVEHPKGYGHGQSFLVWLTRDESVYGTDDTFLEIYRSYDDVSMDRVAQARTQGSLSEDLALEVLFDPGSSYVTIAVNGTEHIRYRLEYPSGSSAELAFRSLGRTEFRHLEIRTGP